MPEFTEISKSQETSSNASTEAADKWLNKAEYAVTVLSTGGIFATVLDSIARGQYTHAALLAIPLAYSIHRQTRISPFKFKE